MLDERLDDNFCWIEHDRLPSGMLFRFRRFVTGLSVPRGPWGPRPNGPPNLSRAPSNLQSLPARWWRGSGF